MGFPIAFASTPKAKKETIIGFITTMNKKDSLTKSLEFFSAEPYDKIVLEVDYAENFPPDERAFRIFSDQLKTIVNKP